MRDLVGQARMLIELIAIAISPDDPGALPCLSRYPPLKLFPPEHGEIPVLAPLLPRKHLSSPASDSPRAARRKRVIATDATLFLWSTHRAIGEL